VGRFGARVLTVNDQYRLAKYHQADEMLKRQERAT